MKNIKAFTLVELIAIMVIIGVISIIVFPQVKSNSYTKKQKQYEKIITTIENAAKVYHIKNSAQSTISIDSLIENDYLASNIINPITNKKVTGCVIVSLTNDNFVNYEYFDDINLCANN